MSTIKELTVMNENGEVKAKHRWKSHPNPEGFVLMYRNAIEELAVDAPNFAVVKIFMLLSSMQHYEGAITTTQKAIADRLGISQVHTSRAFKWLKENSYIGERRINGIRQFVLNPNVTTCGTKRQAKELQWSQAMN